MSLVSTFPPLRHGYKPNRKTRLKSLSASQAAQNVSFWLLEVESRDFSQAEKERIACKDEQIYKMTTIFTQNGLRLLKISSTTDQKILTKNTDLCGCPHLKIICPAFQVEMLAGTFLGSAFSDDIAN